VIGHTPVAGHRSPVDGSHERLAGHELIVVRVGWDDVGVALSVYDEIGRSYREARRPDPRLQAALDAALGAASTVLNVGAGTGNYEPADRTVVAVEPSRVMIGQRRADAAPAVQATAEQLPFGDDCFDAAMAVSTLHHWRDLRAGLAEMCRVAPRRVVYLSEPARRGEYWLVDEYFPEVVEMPTNRRAPTAAGVADMLGGDVAIERFEVPADFVEGSAGAYWARPERYCDPAVQAGLSMFSLLDPAVVTRGTRRLRDDLTDGTWDRRHGYLRSLAALDVGYRIVCSTRH
jgi:SAM-dependent methyltransferase